VFSHRQSAKQVAHPLDANGQGSSGKKPVGQGSFLDADRLTAFLEASGRVLGGSVLGLILTVAAAALPLQRVKARGACHLGEARPLSSP